MTSTTLERLLLSTVLYAASLLCVIAGPTKQNIEALPDIKSPNKTKAYRLLWFNHFEQDRIYIVKFTNLDTAEKMGNDLFKSWCSIFDGTGYKMTGKLVVAADEVFKIDYESWTKEPYSLPKLTKRWFEIMDDERWYIVELEKL